MTQPIFRLKTKHCLQAVPEVSEIIEISTGCVDRVNSMHWINVDVLHDLFGLLLCSCNALLLLLVKLQSRREMRHI